MAATKRKASSARKVSKRKPTTRVRARKTKAKVNRKTKTKSKTSSRRTTAKRKPAKKVAARKTIAARSLNRNSDPYTKTEIFNAIAAECDLTKKQVSNVFESLEEIIAKHINGPGKFNLIGLLKAEVKKKPATKARKGVNPFTGEACIFKAKPARKVVKIKPLKKLKEYAE